MGYTMAGRNCRNRVVEWLCAFILLNFALTSLFMPETIETGSFRFISEIGVSPFWYILSLMTVAAIRLTALIFNGQGLPWSAVLRAVCAIFGGVVFAHMAWVLLYFTDDNGVAGSYALLAVAECFSCMRAGADVNELRNKKYTLGGGPQLVPTIVAVEVVSSGEQPDQERSGRSGSIPNFANGNGHDTGHRDQHRQLTLFEREEGQ